MVTKLHKSSPPPSDRAPFSGSVKDSAQQIWQAGLGAFAKAQAEGTRAFEALVKEGTALQRKTQAAAEDRISDATDRMTHMASDIGCKASGHWDKLENIFEERVAKALNKLGVPSAKEVNALIARIDELKLSVQQLSGDTPASGGRSTTTPRTAKAAIPSRKPTAPTKAKATAKSAAPTNARASTKSAAKAAPRTGGKTAAKTDTTAPFKRASQAAAKTAPKAVKTTRRPAATRKPARTSAAS